MHFSPSLIIRVCAFQTRARNHLALVTALADLADQWDVETVTAYLSALADKAMLGYFDSIYL